MLTLFTTAKPFEGHSGIIQRNALKSWKLLGPEVEVIVFGDDRGAEEACQEVGARFEPHVERHESGMKFANYIFDAAQKLAQHDVMCYLNCDIVLGHDFLSALERIRGERRSFLMVGRRCDIDVTEPIQFGTTDWLNQLCKRKCARRSGDWIDYFAFPKGLYLGRVPPLVFGRVYWDQWLVWKAKSLHAPVVDVSAVVTAIHQNHDYSYHRAGKVGVWSDELAEKNLLLAGGLWHLRTIEDATHVLTPEGLRPNPGQWKRTASRSVRIVKRAAWMAVLDWTRPLRHALGLHAGKKS
jgi:hypothetical protein